MGLLWKPDGPPLPDNSPMALKRLQSVERQLQRDPKFAEGSCKAINAYVGKGFTRKLSAAERAAEGEQWLLPHHPVVSPHKPLPWVVFDSAAKRQGVCLNDCLQTGPCLHNDLPGILLRFRESPVALAGHVSDMFCHVRLRPDDCKYHRYLWRDVELERPPDVYEMNCLVFGDRASPCQANFAVLRTVKDNQKRWPQAAAAVRRNIFVDDFYIACADVPTAISLRADVTALMARGGFPMRKWLSSSREVLKLTKVNSRSWANRSHWKPRTGEPALRRALGVRWDAQSDTLGFGFPHLDRPQAPSTKCGLLRRLSGLYDPLGWASPFIIWAKVILQRTWTRGLAWEKPLPQDMAIQWAQ